MSKFGMTITEVRKLPLREKFQLMEALWTELCPYIDEAGISDAEKKLLDKRICRIDNGEAEVFQWKAVKNSIGKR